MKWLIIAAKQWPLIALAVAIFNGWFAYGTHKDNTELRRQNALAESKHEAADRALVKRSDTLADISKGHQNRTQAIAAWPDDGCLDRDLPNGRMYDKDRAN